MNDLPIIAERQFDLPCTQVQIVADRELGEGIRECGLGLAMCRIGKPNLRTDAKPFAQPRGERQGELGLRPIPLRRSTKVEVLAVFRYDELPKARMSRLANCASALPPAATSSAARNSVLFINPPAPLVSGQWCSVSVNDEGKHREGRRSAMRGSDANGNLKQVVNIGLRYPSLDHLVAAR